jgi:transposase
LQSLPFALPSFKVTEVISTQEKLVGYASSQSVQATCPACQKISSRAHSSYTRSPADLPSSGRLVQLVLGVRRFRCQNPVCQKQTFAERLPSLPAWARQTSRLAPILESIAVVLSGEAGSRVARQFGMPVSADSLLRRAKKPPLTAPSTPRVLGVDDFAFRRGHTYGTMLINLETHQPVDLLPDRSAQTFAQGLRQHPGVEISSRDRSKAYQRGATDGAPAAGQVIDRWHVLKNLREAIERFLSHTQIPNKRGQDQSVQNDLRQKRTSGERARSEGSRRRRLALYQQVNELYQQGGTMLGIARQLKIGHQTVRNCVRAPSFPQWGKPARTRSAIDPYRSYLQERWQQGCRSTPELWHELQARGFTGSRMMV